MSMKKCLFGLVGLILTAEAASAGPVHLPIPRQAKAPVSAVAPLSVADALTSVREALLSYLTIPLGAVPFSDPPRDRP